MLLRQDQLTTHLQKSISPLYFLFGDEPLLVIEAGDAIRAAAKRQGFSERDVLVAGANFKWDDLFFAAGNLSLFGDRKLVDLRIPSGKPGREGGEALQRYAAASNSDIVTLITLPELDWQQKKSPWFLALSNKATTLECNAPPLPKLPQWLAERLARQQQSAPRAALEFLAIHVEGNLLAAHQEIQKLALLYPAGEISLAQFESAVLNVARYDISDLRDAVKAKDLARAARTLEGLKAEAAPLPLVLWTLANEARNNAQTLATRAALMHAAKIDRMVKGIAKGDVWDEFLQLAMRLART